MTRFQRLVLSKLDDTPRGPGSIAMDLGMQRHNRQPQHYARIVGKALNKLREAGFARREGPMAFWVRTTIGKRIRT